MKRFIAIFCFMLAGCAAAAQTRPASVDVDALLHKHPLYATLAQYDRQIAVLQATLHTQFAGTGASIEAASAAMQHDLDHAANVTRDFAASRQTFPPLSFTEASGSQANAAAIQSRIQQTYRAQHAGLQGAAQDAMAQYEADLARQEQAQYAQLVKSVNNRSTRAYAARTQELREKEGRLLLEIARKQAPTRLLLRAKLETLALDAAARRSLQARLNALQSTEYVQVDAMRRGDARTLQDYSAQLHAKADADIAAMRTQLQSRASANIAARERVLAAQNATPRSLNLPAFSAPPGTPPDMRAQYASLRNASLPGTAAYSNARNDLTARFRALHDAHSADTQSVESQIGSLEHDRLAVRKRMVAQIMLEADRRAKAAGYSRVYDIHQAPAGSANITAAVAAGLQTLTP